MKIGDLARQSGVAASRIRFYEASGLLQPAQRQANGYRAYGPDSLTRLEIIDRAQSAGFSLEEIRAILPPDLEAWPHEELIQALRRKVDEIEALEQRLAQSKRGLRLLIDEIAHKAEDEDCSAAARRALDKLRQGASEPARTKARASRIGRRA